MKDQLIKLHDEFVDKGMKKSAWLHIVKIWRGMEGNDRNIGYVLLDLQTWLREEHRYNIIVFNDDGDLEHGNLRYNFELRYVTYSFSDKEKRGAVGNYNFKNYNETLLSGLQEALKLIKDKK